MIKLFIDWRTHLFQASTTLDAFSLPSVWAQWPACWPISTFLIWNCFCYMQLLFFLACPISPCILTKRWHRRILQDENLNLCKNSVLSSQSFYHLRLERQLFLLHQHITKDPGVWCPFPFCHKLGLELRGWSHCLFPVASFGDRIRWCCCSALQAKVGTARGSQQHGCQQWDVDWLERASHQCYDRVVDICVLQPRKSSQTCSRCIFVACLWFKCSPLRCWCCAVVNIGLARFLCGSGFPAMPKYI